MGAIEDFLADQPGLRLAVVPVFFGFGVIWHEGAPWAEGVAAAVEAAKGGQVEYRVEKAGIIHGMLGKASFPAEDLRANFDALMDAVTRAKPSGATSPPCSTTCWTARCRSTPRCSA